MHITEYYFRDINTDSLYCVFGREAAKLFYPRIDEVDPNGKSELTPVQPIIQKIKSQPSTITIIDNGSIFTFPNPNYQIIIKKHG